MNRIRKSHLFFSIVASQLAVLGLLLTHAALATRGFSPALREKQVLVQRLGLTDLCLFTEARYTRHPSQADLHTPFQDHPMSLEHFPSGSFVAPPETIRGINAGLVGETEVHH